MKILIASVMLLFLLVSVEPAFSHSGRTDASGCHDSTSGYHCHNEADKDDKNDKKNKNDDDFGCAIAGFEETHGNIVLNLFFIGLNIFGQEN